MHAVFSGICIASIVEFRFGSVAIRHTGQPPHPPRCVAGGGVAGVRLVCGWWGRPQPSTQSLNPMNP